MDGTVKDSGVPSEIGQQLAYVPRVSFNLWSTYRLPMDLTLGGGTNYSDGNYFNQTGGFCSWPAAPCPTRNTSRMRRPFRR